MGQLSRRLAEICTEHGIDPRAWQPQLDAVADLEAQGDHKRAHERFIELKLTLQKARLADLADALRAHGRVTDLPFLQADALTERERERLIPRLENAVRLARDLDDALAEAERVAGSLQSRRFLVDAHAFRTVAFEDLPRAVTDATAVRGRAFSEARLEERARAVARRARALKVRRVPVPDAETADDAVLAAAEDALAVAERVEDALARVERALKDASVREFKARSGKNLKESAREAARSADADEALARLDRLAGEAEALRVDAAALASQAARSRRRGGAPPEKEKGAGDLPDYYA